MKSILKRFMVFCSVMVLLAIAGSSVVTAQVGPPGSMIYANDQTYRTVATPTDLPPHGKFDAIYVLGGDFAPVSEAAPGDRDYNGGRWEARVVEFLTIDPVQFTNDQDILDAEGRGEIAIGDVVARFVCPLIRN